jgi:hypothetical protein
MASRRLAGCALRAASPLWQARSQPCVFRNLLYLGTTRATGLPPDSPRPPHHHARGFAAQAASEAQAAGGGSSGSPTGGVDLLHVLQVQARSKRSFLTAIPRRSLCAETGLTLRDLRVVDPSFRVQVRRRRRLFVASVN